MAKLEDGNGTHDKGVQPSEVVAKICVPLPMSLGFEVPDHVTIELTPEFALQLWLELDDYLQEQGLVWDDVDN